jgi:PAS domain S-box-containing protein
MDDKQFKRMADQNPTPIMVTDLNGDIVYVNRAFIETTGYSLKEILGRNPRILKSGSTPPEMYKNLWDTVLSGKVWHGDVYNKRKNGEIFLESIFICPLKDEKGKSTHFLGVWQDVTERKRIETLKDAIIGYVAHELCGPLALIHEAIEQVVDGTHGEVPKGQKETLSISLKTVSRLSRMVGNLLDVSMLQFGRIQMNRKSVNIIDVACDCVSVFSTRAKKRGIQIKSESKSQRIQVYADAEKISEVFTNLIGNALNFTEKGQIVISLCEKGEMVECSVSDTGKGIPADAISKVFGKFQRFGTAYVSAEKGVGLGLAISKGYIEAHHGKIFVESQLNKGTKVTFTLPKDIRAGKNKD